MRAIWKTMQEFATIGGILFFFPGIFGFESEFRGLMRRYIHWTLPVFVILFTLSAIVKHAEIQSQKSEFAKRLKGASLR